MKNYSVRPALLVAWVAFGWLLLGSSPSHYWLDAGQIAAAGAEWGVMHPPGAPGFLPLLHLATAVPVGSLGFRMTLVSSALGAATIGLAALVLARRDAHVSVIAGMAASMLGALTFLRHGRALEIYTFGACLMMLAVWGFDPATPRRRRVHGQLLGTLALAIGALGFGDLRLLTVFGLGFAWLRALWRQRPWARWAPLVVAFALLATLTLPLRAATEPVANWGDPSALSQLWLHLSAASIRTAYAAEMWPTSIGPWVLHLGDNATRLVEDVGPLAVVLVVGAFVGRRRPVADRRLAYLLAGLVALELFYAVAINPMGGRDRQTGLTLGVVVALLLGLSAHAWLPRRKAVVWAIAPLVWLAVVAPAWIVSWRDLEETRSWGPSTWARDALAVVPPGALVLTQSDDLSAGVLAARVLEGARPDLGFVPAQHLGRPVPTWLRDDDPLARAWQRARDGTSDDERLRRIIDAWPGSVAVEHAHNEVLAGMDKYPLAWGVPLSLVDPPVSWPRLDLARATEQLTTRYRSVGDRTRVGVALSAYARARVRVDADPRAYAEAEAVLTTVVRDVAPGHPSALVALGGVYDRLGRPARAISVTRTVLEIEPDRHTALTNLALYLSRDESTLDEARELAERAVYLRPHLRSGWRRLADVAARQGDDQAAAYARERASGR